MNTEASSEPLDQPEKVAKGLFKRILDYPFEYIDSFQSEAKRRVGHALFSTLIIATFSAIARLVWVNWTSIVTFGKWTLSGRFYVTLNFWVCLVFSIAVGWLFLIIYKIRNFNKKLDGLRASVNATSEIIESKNEQIAKLNKEIEVFKNDDGLLRSGHDKNIFRKLDGIVSEREFCELCRRMGDYYMIDQEGYAKLLSVNSFGMDIADRFLDSSLKDKFDEFKKALGIFMAIGAEVFFGYGDKMYKLYPNLKDFPKESREGSTYRDAQNRISVACDNVIEKYAAFRGAIKEKLYI